jgi:hypothetical protein
MPIFSICVVVGFVLNFSMYGILFVESIYLSCLFAPADLSRIRPGWNRVTAASGQHCHFRSLAGCCRAWDLRGCHGIHYACYDCRSFSLKRF